MEKSIISITRTDGIGAMLHHEDDNNMQHGRGGITSAEALKMSELWDVSTPPRLDHVLKTVKWKYKQDGNRTTSNSLQARVK